MSPGEHQEDPMAAAPRRSRYCLACGTESTTDDRFCRKCGGQLQTSSRQRREGAAFLLNELESLRQEGVLLEHLYTLLRDRYREALGLTDRPAPAPTTVPPEASEPPPPEQTPERRPAPAAAAPPKREGPSWLAEQQASLLLYLGAFLIIIATLIFVGRSEQALGDSVKMAILVVYTLLFLAAGLFCMRIQSVRQAGVVFFAVGALMVPLSFVGAYAFFFADEDIDPTGLWLAGSLASALFYSAVAMLGLGRWYPVPAVTASLSSLAALLVLINAPAEAYPGSYMVLAMLLATASQSRVEEIRAIFGDISLWAANIVMPAAFIAALQLAALSTQTSDEPLIELRSLWFLPPTLAVATLFYGTLAWRKGQPWYSVPAVVAALSVLVSTLAVVDVPAEVYPGAVAAASLLMIAPSIRNLDPVSDVFGEAGLGVGNIAAPAAAIAAIWVALSSQGGDPAVEVRTLWFLPPTLALVAGFYAVQAMAGLQKWASPPAAAAALLAFVSVLAIADVPPEVYPGSLVAAAAVFAIPALIRLGRVSDIFGETGLWSANLIVPPAMIAALVLTSVERGDALPELATRWYLPPTAALAALFYWWQAARPPRPEPEFRTACALAALAVAGGAAVTITYALDVGYQWYGPTVAIVGWLYAAGSEGFGPRWFGQRFLGWMALGAITVAWLFFEGVYADFPRHGAGAHFAAVAMYLAAARLVTGDLKLLPFEARPDGEDAVEEIHALQVPAASSLVYGAGLTLGIGFYYLLASLPAAETAGASDLSLAFFGLSLGVAAIAATMRWWWPDMRLHTYVIALGMSLFVLLSSAEAEGQVAAFLAVYTGVALALALWEQEPLALSLPAAFGFFAILAAWRHFEPNDAYFPLAFSAAGSVLFAAAIGLRGKEERWASVATIVAFAYLAVAPVAGWIRLDALADPAGFVGTEHFAETALYQTCAAAVFILGLAVVGYGWVLGRAYVAAAGSVLLMVAVLLEIGHFRPENVQAYTVLIGLYLLAGGALATRVRDLPQDLQSLIGPLQALGAAVLMGPSLAQSWEEGGSMYALILLGEALALLGVALVQRWVWLLSTATGFVVLDALRYLFDAARVLPNELTLGLAGLLLLAAGMAILLGREHWTSWQRQVQAWWMQEPATSSGKP